jgi:hypothetical protein
MPSPTIATTRPWGDEPRHARLLVVRSLPLPLPLASWSAWTTIHHVV